MLPPSAAPKGEAQEALSEICRRFRFCPLTSILRCLPDFGVNRICFVVHRLIWSGGALKSSVHDERYQAIISDLRRTRMALNLSQAELATKLGRRQQFVSKYESGERRLDVVEFVDILEEMGVDHSAIVGKLIGFRPRR